MDREVKDKYSEWIAVCIIVIVICGLGTIYLSSVAKGASNLEARRMLSANVKGSIYGEGELMSVFGTCIDSNGIPVNSTATLSAWYPNGTQYAFGDSMAEMAQGYFLWNGIMSVVGGTYLTELTCSANISGEMQEAKAWGEWQNPVWVAKIGAVLDFVNATNMMVMDMEGNLIAINATVNEINDFLQSFNFTGNWSVSFNLTEVLNAISGLSVQVAQGFNDTNSLIISGFNNQTILINGVANNITLQILQSFNYTNALILNISDEIGELGQNISFLQQNMTNSFNNTNSLILQTQIIANSSVDRNNSLLAQLLYLLMNWSQGGAPCLGITADEYSVDDVRYYHDWTIKVKAYESGRAIGSPSVACVINTTQTSPAVYMTPEGDHFTYTETIRLFPGTPFSWNTRCFCPT